MLKWLMSFIPFLLPIKLGARYFCKCGCGCGIRIRIVKVVAKKSYREYIIRFDDGAYGERTANALTRVPPEEEQRYVRK